MKKIRAALLLVALAAALVPAPAYAAPEREDKVVFGGTFVLERGEVLDGDLVMFGGNAELEQGSRITGDMFLMGGNVEAAGTIEGDLALLGGNVTLGETSRVQGDVAVIGGNLNRAPGARIDGQVVTGEGVAIPFDFNFPFDFNIPGLRSLTPFESFRFRFSPLLDLVWFGFRTLLMAALAVLVVMFWPKPTERAAKTVVDVPLLAGGLGFLTVVVVPILAIVLAISIILLPVSFLAVVLLVIAGVYGWIAVGLEVGNRMADSFKWSLQPAAAAGVGTLVLSVVVGGIGLVPCIGWIFPLLVISLGLGSIVLTRFGSRAYQPAAASAPAEEPPKRVTRTRRTPTRKT